MDDMKKRMWKLLGAVFCTAALAAFPALAAPAEVPSYVEIPKEGEYTMGEEQEAAADGANTELGTDFYIYIENPGGHRRHDSGSGDQVVASPGALTTLPKTGDYGMDGNTLLLTALFCGAGYLFCEHYAKKLS